jgi:DMSO reductase anchor subunit
LLSLSLAGGALLASQVSAATGLLVIAGIVQLAAWGLGDRQFARAGHTLASATGLGEPGRVRAFEPPHTGSNFLLDEMVHVVGRKHAMKLRIIAFVLAFALPILLIGVFHVGHVLAGIAVLSHLAGVLVSRWLFFAEAEHVVGLYYGKR